MIKFTYVDGCEMDLAKDTGAPTISPENEYNYFYYNS